MPLKLGKIHQGDCLTLMHQIEDGSIDLAFADPPFNIGYKYDKYHDRLEDKEYLDWCSEWISELHRVLRPTGTFWLAIGDEYAAELKVAATRQIATPFIMRGWVVWYYTFGVNCTKKFSRSHAHIFYYVRDPKRYTFNPDAIRVPSARQTTYADRRANPVGKLPDDTWVLRPQETEEHFRADQDTWFVSRVCGTFKERVNHPCQMPEGVLERIIRVASNPGDAALPNRSMNASGSTLPRM